jgi:hypothetical protein
MSNDMSQWSELELEFAKEVRGEGSLSFHLARDPSTFSKQGDGHESYVGFDFHPEDLDALYFEGLQVPRWDSIKAENLEQHRALYMESYQKIIEVYPLTGRISELDRRISYTPEEVLKLREECDSVLSNTTEPKAIKALQKLTIAVNKAIEQKMGMVLLPSH